MPNGPSKTELTYVIHNLSKYYRLYRRWSPQWWETFTPLGTFYFWK